MIAPARFLIHWQQYRTPDKREGYFLWDGPKFVKRYDTFKDANDEAVSRAKDGDKLNYNHGDIMHGVEIGKPVQES